MKNKFRWCSIVLLVCLVNGCASTTLINSDPNGAQLYIDGMKVGKTPYIYTDSKFVGSTTLLKFKKEGYEDLNVVMQKNEKANVGAIVGGACLLVPFLWMMEYHPDRTYELELKKDN